MADTPKKARSRPRATTAPNEAILGPDTRPTRQAPLFRDPMPERVEPCLATLSPKMPVGSQWAYEIKWDGYRLHVHIKPAGVRIITRGGHDWTHRFPAIAAAATALGAGTAILDGEAVVLDEQGRSSFAALQQVLGGRGGKRVAPEAMFYAFDALYLDGVWISVTARSTSAEANWTVYLRLPTRSRMDPTVRGGRGRRRRVAAARVRDGARRHNSEGSSPSLPLGPGH